MDELLVLKPKIRPYVVMIGVLAILVVITTLALAAAFSEYGFVILLVGFLLVLLLVLAIIQQFYRRWYTTYTISESDVTWRLGVFAPDERVIPIDEIIDIDVDRSILGMIFGLGDICLDTPGAERGPEVVMKDIDAAELSKAVELMRSLIKERGRGGRAAGEPSSKTK
jgi:uncharacterized membrane protein YdbT with pleckstrin-like domain